VVFARAIILGNYIAEAVVDRKRVHVARCSIEFLSGAKTATQVFSEANS